MGVERLSWAMSVAAPWLGAAGLLVSFTAEANQELPSGASRRGASLHAAVMPREFEPLPGVFDTSGFSPSSGRGMLREARLYTGAPTAYPDAPDEMEPRPDLKKNARNFPEIDRSHKGDPLVGLRPSLSGRLRQHDGIARVSAELLTFTTDRSGLASSFVAADGPAPGPDTVAAFEPWAAGENPVTPGQEGGGSTMRPAAIAERDAQGATPAPGRAESLASTTPYDAGDTPVEVLADALSPAGDPRFIGGALSSPSLVAREGRNILTMIAPEKLEAEKRCLAQAIYFEARGEPETGQAAVAQVVLNRMTSGLYPSSICGVVFQNRSHYKACQFSFACEGRSLRVHDAESWAQAQRIADDALEGRSWLAAVGTSTHYHANYVRPRWARTLKKMDVIGRHIFYRLRPGQS
ncbi:cell wall hydrolase [Rhodoblastus acidophilus]|uniref:Cell wall hydrolase n=1 Tax=Rhodoblastus acidophilus TaxID=1074 RepID=A0A6N8DI08_RHOAC|nr:cell wall hydrolase [Rhodoblastus acidophilus]MCW2273006.1 hypothetical protein [Rhodoblastus acidophilus]MTV29907.1 cell wall hydrolase [Rhodoblastus acidophilus]